MRSATKVELAMIVLNGIGDDSVIKPEEQIAQRLIFPHRVVIAARISVAGPKAVFVKCDPLPAGFAEDDAAPFLAARRR